MQNKNSSFVRSIVSVSAIALLRGVGGVVSYANAQSYMNSLGEVRSWIKSDTSVTYDGSNRVSDWGGFSNWGNINISPTFVSNYINGYPAIRFSKVNNSTYDDYLRSSAVFDPQNWIGKSVNIFAAVRSNPAMGGKIYEEWDGTDVNDRNIYATISGSLVSWSAGHQSARTSNSSVSTSALPSIWSFQFNSQVNGTNVKRNGIFVSQSTSANGLYSNNASQGGNYTYPILGQFDGDVMEMIAIRESNGTSMTASATNRIESYLMIKYGIAPSTSSANLYNTNNGLVWNSATNTTYNNNIFGIGRDAASSLNSTTSQSAADTTLKIQSSVTLVDQQYLMMGDNGASIGWTTSGAPSNTSKTSRNWLIQKTGPTNAYTTTFSIPASQITGYDSAKVYLTIDSDADFTAGSTSYEMTNTAGVFSVGGVTVSNGQYVTITYVLPPAAITGRVWLDTNSNGIEDAAETSSLNSVTVKLRSCVGTTAGNQPPINDTNGDVTSPTTTNGAGVYSFSVPAGLYYLEFTLPSTYKFTSQSVAGSNATNDSDAHPYSGRTKCVNFASNTTTSNIDVGAITQVYSSCDSLTLSNTVMVGGLHYQKPSVGFTANLVGYGQNATIAGTNVSGVGVNNGTWRAITWNQALSSTVLGAKTITANIDGADYKLDYYNNPAILSVSLCPYKTNAGVYCAQAAPLAPYSGGSINMNSSPTTPAPISYCGGAQASWSCTTQANMGILQSALVKTTNTCTQNITIYDEAAICNSLVTDMSAADCNGLIELYNSAGGSSWTNKSKWLFNGDTTWDTACDWYGVTCAGGRLTQINLPSNNMGGTLPSLPAGAWTALTNFVVRSNLIGGTLPTAWSTLTAMQYFDIGDTDIGGSLPTQWSTWTQMKGFWCYDARLVTSLPTQWSTWSQLITFNCGYQQGYSTATPPYGINGTLPSTWSTMTQLQDLYLHWNKISGQIPTSWSSMTAMRNFVLTKNQLDGPIPSTVESWTNLNTNGWNSVLGSNCMGTVGLSTSLTNWLNSRFKGDATTSWNNAGTYGWQSQDKCAVDIQITSATITQGDLVNGLSATYSVVVKNNSATRWAYSPKVTVTLAGGLVTSTPVLSYGILAPGASETQTLIVTKGSVAAGTNNVTNSFTVADTTITDGTTTNNTVTNSVSVKGSAYVVCNSSALTTSVVECESLSDLYSSTNGANWVAKTNRTTSPDIGTWFGVTTTAYTDAPAMWYSFDDNSSTDKSSNGRNGTIGGGTTFTSGKFGNAASFDGTSTSKITTVDTSFAGNNITWSVWVNRTQSINEYNMIMGQYLPYLAFRSAGKIHWSPSINGVQQSILSTSTLADNQWYLVTVTYDGSTAKIYINGALDASASLPGTLTYTSSRKLIIGGWDELNPGDNSFKGKIDEVRIYNRTLTPVEIAQLYNGNTIKSTVTSLNLSANGVCGWGADASTNNLVGTLPESLGNLGSLNQLCIALNPGLVGGLPSTFGNLRLMNNLILHSNPNLKGQLPANITQMNPSVLRMHNNGFTGGLSMIGSWNKTTYLGLYDNGFTGPIPSTVSNMAAMYYFRLSNNPGLTGPLPSQLFSLPNIGYVILSSNSLNTPIPTLTYNPSLTYIDLNSAGITGNPWSELAKMTNLTQLHISGNPGLTGPIPSTINNLTKLTHLNISSNPSVGGALPNFTIPTLQYLWANTSNFNGALPSLPSSLLNFEAQDNQFSGLLPTSWGSLSNLQYLYLWNSSLEGQIPTQWANMVSLRRLGLGNNNLEGAMPVATLQSMTSLETNPWGSMLGQNCFYNGLLNASQMSFLDTKFSYWAGTEYRGWRQQRTCGTDLEVVSVTPVGTLQGSTTMTYTITYRNNGPRTAYDPKLTITLANGLQFSDSASNSKVISLGQMAANASASQIITINKLGVGATTINYTNSFVISDTTTTDTSTPNNTKTHAGTANGSAYPTACLSTSLTVTQADCEALGDLYTATAGGSWTNKTNRLTSPDVGTWFGVTVAGGRVTLLNLNTNNLIGTIPESIGNLTQLTQLYLYTNAGLTGPIPSTIDQLDELTHMYIYNTKVNGSLPTTIGGMAKLTYLHIYSTDISGVPSQIVNLPMINQLQLQYNKITSLPDMTALNNTLRVFYFHGNQITGPIPSWMGNLTNLTHFYIGYNSFTAGPVPSWICNMTNLQYLYIAGDSLTGEVPSCFNNGFPQMRQFQIQGNQLEGELPNLSNSTYLTHYYVHSNRFVGGMPKRLPSISTFRYLYLDNNRLTGPIPDEYANMSTASIIFRISNNNLDRDTSNNALISPALQTWWNNIVPYNNDPVNYKLISSQGDITAPLLGANAKRIPATPSFNRNGKSVTQTQITGPNGSPVVATLLGGSPNHVGYDAGYHLANLQNGKTYTFSFWARTVAGSRTIYAGFTDDVNTNFQYQSHTIDTNWKQVHATYTYTSSLGASPRIFITNTAGSDFYYYDPVVTESTNLPTAIDTNAITYPLMITDGSDWDTAGRAVSVGGGGSCSNLTVTPNKNKDNGLALYYNFDDSTATDDSNNNLNGTLVNSPTFVDGPGGVGKAINFDGTQKRVVINNTTIPKGTSDFTYSWWTKRNGSVALGSYFENGSWGSSLIIRQESASQLSIYSMSSLRGTFAFTPVVGQWYHLSIVRSGNIMYLYINGVQSGSITFNVDLQPSTSELWIGSSQHAPTQAINAAMDDVRIYNRALSATEIGQLYGTTINIAAQGSYAGCYLTTTDRANNTSNAVRLGDFTATFSPYPICNDPARTVPQSECTALMDIYTSAGGANWSQKTNWSGSADMGTWRGVTVANGHVTQLCLNRLSTTNNVARCAYDGIGNNLVGSLTGSIGDLPYITDLTLSNNAGLTGPLPTTIGNLVNLKYLYAIYTSLDGSLPESITNLNSLIYLFAWNSKFSGSLPSSWGTGMNNIRYIYLANNYLSGPIPTNWANLSGRLQDLILSNQLGTTKLNGTIPTWLGNFNINLHLRLDSNQFTGPIPKELGNISSNNLFLNNNQLSGPIPPELANNTTMVDLRLQGNNLTGAIPDSFTGLTNLTTFYVNSNNLDRDISNNAIVSPVLTTWYNARTTKLISSQGDITTPIISGNPLAGTYSFATMNYDITLTENSDIATGGMTVTVAGGGTCSQISVVGTLTNKAGSNTIQLNFAPGSNATTAYSNCTLQTTDRAGLVSNTINLGSFSVKLNPFPICNNTNITVSQEQCTALMDFYTNTNGSGWTNKTNWSAGTTVGNWYGITTANSLVGYYTFDSSNTNDTSPLANNGTNVNGVTFGAGKYGNAAQFDGTQKRIVVTNTNLPKGTSDFTYSWWTKRNATPGSYQSYFENGTRSSSLIIRQENSTTIRIYAMGVSVGAFAFTPTVGQWYHLSIIRLGNLMYFYVNGTQVGSALAFNINLQPSANLWIGASQYAPTQAINASMDEIRIFNRGLSADEVNQLYLSNTMGDQTVTKIQFTGANNLVGTFPNVFDRLPDLTNIVINGNIGITGPIPSTISNLTKLVELGLSSLGVNGSLPSVLPTALTSLSINTMPNMTAGPLPSNWSSLTGLAYMSLQNINANGDLPSTWSALTNLTYMHLANNNFNSQIPTSWLTALTGIGQMYWEGANIDGPLPPEMATWNTNTAYGSNYLTNNCFGTGHLTPAQVNAFDTKYTRAKWATQRKCTTDLQVSISQAGNLTTSNAMLYTVTVTNAGSRWAYTPRVTVNLQGGLQYANTSNPVISYDTLAPGASQTQTITVVKSATTPTTQTNVTNTFTVSDATITDTINNVVTDVEAVKASTKSYCNHYALNTTIAECEALGDLYTSTAGASWTNKTNWLTSPNTDSWFGITTSNDDDLVAHYTFDNSNGNDDAGVASAATVNAGVTFEPGRLGSTATINGAGNAIRFPTPITLGNGNWTASAWVKTNYVGASTMSALGNRDSGPVFNDMGVQNGKIVYWNYDGTRRQNYGTRNINDGNWHHLVRVNKANNTMDMYVDGTFEVGGFGSLTLNGGPVNSIGRNWNATMSGSIDDVRIYNRGLTAGEITNLYQTANPTVDRVVSLQLGNGGTYSDAGGNNLSGTIPSNLSDLTELRYLWLNGNSKLIGTIPSNFWNLTKLEEAILFWTQLSGNLPAFGSSFPALRSINISHTRVSGSLPTTWSQNTGLTSIWLGVNPFGSEKITGILPPERGLLKSLSSFATYYAGLTGPIPTTWGAMQNMSNFQIQGNQMSGPLPPSLSQWSGPNAFIINSAANTNQFTGDLQMLSGWSVNTMTHFMVYGANFDRDSSNNAIVPANIAGRATAMGGNYLIGVQGDITPPVLTGSSTVTKNADDVMQVTFSLIEGSSTTGAGFTDGLTVGFTGSAACASLATSPVKLLNKGSMVIDIIGPGGTSYSGCSLWVRDRANLISNLLSLATFTIPNYAICGTVTDITRSDCKALVDIYTDTNGSGWTNKTNWMGLGDATPTTACDWFGIQCGSGRVTGICMNAQGSICGGTSTNAGNNLVGSLPSTLTNLTGLVSLMMQNNYLTGTMPTISNITTLQNVYVQGSTNNLNGPLPDFGPGIINIYLNDNKFTGPIPASYCAITSLGQLYLDNNPLNTTLPSCLPTFAGTSVMSIRNAQLQGYLPSWTSSTIKYLYLNDNSLIGSIPESLGSISSLLRIYLHNNNLKGLMPSTFANLTNLVNNESYLNNNCLSSSSSYMTTGLQSILTSKFNNYTTQKTTCANDIRTTVWNDSNNDGQRNITETKISGVTATLRACTDQTPYNTSEKLLNRELSAYYSFDTDNTIDDSNNGNNAVNNGMTYTDGKIGRAIVGSNGASNGPYLKHSTQGMNSTNGTISTWIKPNTVGPWGVRQTHNATSVDYSDWISMFSYTTTSFYFRMMNGSAYNDLTFNPTTYITPNAWNHLTFTWEGDADGVADDTMRIYINATLIASKTNANFQSIMDPDARIGYSYQRGTNGTMDDFRAYGRALSASEVSQLYQSTNPQAAVNIPIGYAGASVTSANTAADGTATFANRAVGKYYIEYSNIPAGYKFTTQNVGGVANIIGSDVNPWSAKTSCFELHNGTSELSIDAGLKYLPYSSCEASTPAATPILLGQPVTLSIGGYGTNGQIQAINSSSAVVLDQSITNQGTNRGLKTWTYNWTPTVAGTYTISGAVDGYNYKLDYYNNASLLNLSCAYRTVSPGVRCAMSGTVAPYSGSNLNNVNQIATIPAPIQYCTAAQISMPLPCSTAGDQPPAMVVQVPNTCTSSLIVTSDVNVMCDAVTDMQPAECKALVSLYDSTAGASWTTKTNWRFLGDTTPRTACDWTGVTCAGGRVTQLSLGANNLNGTLPALTGLTELTVLTLNNNSIKGNLPTVWPTTLPKLATINLYVNQMTGSLPTTWGSDTSLVSINLNYNAITGGLPANWSGMTNINTISLDYNTVGGTLPTSWSALTKLQTLSVIGGGVVGGLPTQWSTMIGLRNIYLSGNGLTGEIPSSWLTLTGLNILGLSNNNIDGPIPSGITSLTNLTANSWSDLTNNCMGTTHVSGSLQSFLNIKFPSRYATQKTCQTDLQLSLVSKTGSLFSANSITYTLRYSNAGSRRSYNTILGLNSSDSRVGIASGSTTGVTKTGLNLGILAPGSSGTITFVIDKSGFSGGLYSINNAFTLTDTTISDLVSNHSYTDTGVQVLGSSFPICRNAGLTVTQLECETLMTWYTDLGGPSWTNKTGWGTDPVVNNWYGITANSGRVKEINFSAANNMVGTIPNVINNLSAVTLIQFYAQPGVIGSFPSSFTQLTGLTQLFIGGTSMSGAIPASISDLKSLQALAIIGDRSTRSIGFTSIPSSLYNLTGLSVLYLNNNYFSGVLPNLTGFNALRYLDLSNNDFDGIIPSSWGSIGIREVNLANNKLDGEIPTSYQSWASSLELLKLNDNEIDGPIPEWLTGFVNLQ